MPIIKRYSSKSIFLNENNRQRGLVDFWQRVDDFENEIFIILLPWSMVKVVKTDSLKKIPNTVDKFSIRNGPIRYTQKWHLFEFTAAN